jgi:dolichol-phosphate mannosyltransferase
MSVVPFEPVAKPTSARWVAPELAVIVPSYNERDNIGLLYEKVSTALAGTPFEFIVVDDNSPDGTSEVVRDMAQRHPNVRGIHRIGRRGLSSAVVEGILASAAPYFAVIDADLQHDERILPQMLEKAKAGDHIVVGTRYGGDGSVGEGLSSTREAGSRLATKLSGLITGKALSDPMSGFFLMRRSVFDDDRLLAQRRRLQDPARYHRHLLGVPAPIQGKQLRDRRGALHLPPPPCRREQDELARRRAVPRP